MSVLITGSKGFIGERMCAHLADMKIQYEEMQGDIRNTDEYPPEQYEYVIHLAALIPQQDSWSQEELVLVNVKGTRSLFDHYPTAKFIYISTNDVTVEPLTEYAKTKLEAENIILQNTDNVVIRLPSIFGPKQKQDKLVKRLFRHYYERENFEILNNEEREYMFVDDVAREIWDNREKNGVMSLEGVKVRNKRLQELIESVYLKKTPQNMTFQESAFFSQLVECGKDYQGH